MTLFAVMLRCLKLCDDKARRLSELSANFKYADSLLVEPAVDRLLQLELLEWVKWGHGRRRLRLDTTKRGERILSKRWKNLHPGSVFRLTRDDITKRDVELPFSGVFAQTARMLEERVFRSLNIPDLQLTTSGLQGVELEQILVDEPYRSLPSTPQEEPQHDADNDAD